MVYSGAWGNWFMKKTRSPKSRDTVPLKFYVRFKGLNTYLAEASREESQEIPLASWNSNIVLKNI
jgi:hypothetical protein